MSDNSPRENIDPRRWSMLKSSGNGRMNPSRLIAQLRNRNTIAVSSAHYNLPSIASHGEKHCKVSLRSKIETRREMRKNDRRKYFLIFDRSNPRKKIIFQNFLYCACLSIYIQLSRQKKTHVKYQYKTKFSIFHIKKNNNNSNDKWIKDIFWIDSFFIIIILRENPTFRKMENSELWHRDQPLDTISRVMYKYSFSQQHAIAENKRSRPRQTGVSFFAVETFERTSRPSNEHPAVTNFRSLKRKHDCTRFSSLLRANSLTYRSSTRRVASDKEQCSRINLTPFRLILSLLNIPIKAWLRFADLSLIQIQEYCYINSAKTFH